MCSAADKRNEWLSFGLALVGGYGDAAGFVIAKTFTGHVTGSLVLATIGAGARDWGAALGHGSAVVVFLAGIPLSVLLDRGLAAWSSWRLLPTVMGIEVILIVTAHWASASRAAFGTEAFVACMSLALGLQNGAFRRTGGISVHTTYITGMITGLLAREAESHAFPMASRVAAANNPPVGLLYGIWGTFLVG